MLYLEVKLLQANYDLCIYRLKCHKISKNEMFKEKEARKKIRILVMGSQHVKKWSQSLASE